MKPFRTRNSVKQVAEASGFGGKVGVVDAVGRERMGDALGDVDAAGGEGRHFFGVVGEEADARQVQLAEHGGGDVEIALVGFPAEGAVGVDGVEAAVLQGIGAELVDEADAAALLGKVHDGPGALGGHAGDGALQLRAAIASQRAQEVACKTFGVDADQGGGVGGGLAD